MLAPQDEVIADSEDESYYPLETSKSFTDVSSVRKSAGSACVRIICLGDCGIYLLK